MGTVTYPNEKVTEFVTQKFVTIRIQSNVEPYASKFNVKWTPRIFALDSNGKEHQSTLGFFPPETWI